MDSRVVFKVYGQEAKAKTIIIYGIAVTASQFLVLFEILRIYICENAVQTNRLKALFNLLNFNVSPTALRLPGFSKISYL